MIVVDSSGWLEYFADGPNADVFAPLVGDPENLIVPSISLFEIFKRVRTQRDVEAALRAVAQMKRGQVVDLDADMAISAAELSAELRLPLAESVILETARSRGAILWTQDADFEGLEGVEYRAHGG
jgi:predicted nucleic acid-binding protein